ncbi:membrane protease YdiL (CAAX protease family) [Rhodovulum iodosum]|uniref:Membrane protease YdiL (CAAX protease family) n=1 Tax=Rhodovulum iodosum TaxID=68291 RepID=A0ABV3XXK4_9RHOB|nr:CPBP family intramembrane glutamic endopeptidase [Rhodovulum robiginosum]
MGYYHHEILVRPARARPDLWRLGLGLLLAGAVYQALVYTSYGLAALAMGDAAATAVFHGVFTSTLTSTETLLLLYSFGFLAVGIFVAARLLQDRRPFGLTGPFFRAYADFAQVTAALGVLYAGLGVLLPTDVEVYRNVTFGTWLTLLPLALPALLVQTSAEELLFRGYLQQQLAARFNRRVVWMGVPAALFAVGHYMPETAGENAKYLALWAGLFSLCAADLTARTGTLGAAIGLHFANNVLAVLVTSLPGAASGLSLYTYAFSASSEAMQPLIAIDFAVIGLSWLTCRVALRV